MVFLNDRMNYFYNQLENIEEKVFNSFFEKQNESDFLKETIDLCISEFPNWYYGYLCLAEFIFSKSSIENDALFLEDYSDEAIPYLEKAIQIDPKNAEPYFIRAELHSYKCRLEESILDYQKAIELNPNLKEAYEPVASYLINKYQDYQGAIKMYSKLIELEGDKSINFYLRGNAKIQIKDYFEAILDFNKSIEIDPKFFHCYLMRGVAKKEINDFAGALSDFNIALSLNSRVSEAYEERGKLKELLNDFNGAKEDFEKAKEHDLPF